MTQHMAKSNPFKVNDRVYVYPAGWGSINQSGIDTCEIDFDGGPIQKIDWRLASFTEYDPIKGGLSHERQENSAIDAINEISKAARQLIDRRLNRRLAKDEDGKYKNIPTAYEQKALDFIEQKLSEGYKLTEYYVSIEGLGDEVLVSLTFRKG